MNTYKTYIFGALILLSGIILGWILKPNAIVKATDHGTTSDHEHQEVQSNEIWTCSMHPQIRQNEFGLCPICEMDLIPLDNSMSNDDPAVLQMSKESAKLAQIETLTVGGNAKTAKDNNSLISTDGVIEIDESSIKSQTAHLPGRIETMAVTFENQFVRKGQEIASLYSVELLAASQELLTAVEFDDRVDGLKAAAIQKLKNWKLSDTQISQILKEGKPVETLKIYADHSGYVVSKKLSQGDYVKQGQSLFTLASTHKVWLIFNVFESDISNVKVGNDVLFTTPSMPNKQFKAKITYIDPILNTSTRTAMVRAEMINKNNAFKPGMLVNGKISANLTDNSKGKSSQLSIPNSAILWTGKKSIVYVQDPDNEVPTYSYREVEVLKRSGEYSLISSGLDEGEKIVAHGAFAIDAAAQLNNNMSMMNKNVSIKKEVAKDIIPSFSDSTVVEFKDQLNSIVEAYIQLKNALVNTDYNATSLEADMLLNSLSKVDMQLINGEAHTYWMQISNGIKEHGEKVKNENDIEQQRAQFEFLSKAIINALKAFGTNENTYYVQYCPMVNNNKGADWLSLEKEIKNPYFGDKMMKCGSVKLELK